MEQVEQGPMLAGMLAHRIVQARAEGQMHPVRCAWNLQRPVLDGLNQSRVAQILRWDCLDEPGATIDCPWCGVSDPGIGSFGRVRLDDRKRHSIP